MTALRHPNVVLFMAASTTPPKLCIVMEFMGLGSLYDLLHNELMPSIPVALKVKMAYQAAKGMHFLHSSGIVHRDLKSLNLLLDSKWNVKVLVAHDVNR
jgi:serine/threonine protein kinase